MQHLSPVVLILVCLFGVAGVVAAVCLQRRLIRHRVLRKIDREMNRQKTINAKHSKRHRAKHDQNEMLQFGFVKLRDIGSDLVKIADTYAEHAARESREVDR